MPTDDRYAGDTARASQPFIRQVLVAASDELPDQDAFERKLYVIRRLIEIEAGDELAIPSFSSRTLVYKGMLTAPQLPRYFTDLRDPRLASRLALVHSRFSTNTFPSWTLAHPFRMIAHNGEINTLRGNANWMRARESQLASELFGDDLARIMPVIQPDASDSAALDNVLELLVLSGRSIPHAMMMMIPEAYRTRKDLDPDVKGFYDFHSCLLEPWDGPAAVVFTDGKIAGATLDRNGLRPGRWIQDTEGYVVLASEAGVLTVAPEHIQRKGRLAPGKMFLLDLEQGKIVEDEEVKRQVARRQPYGDWYQQAVVHIDDLPERDPQTPRIEPLRSKQLAFGYSQEDLKLVIAPMAAKAEEPVASMGNDAALAVLSDRQPPLFSYFKQLFAQVTNPPIDPIREQVVMSLQVGVGRERNLLVEVARAGPPAGHGSADPAQPRAREAAPGLARDLRRRHARHHLADRARRRRHARAPRGALRGGRPLRRQRRQHPDPVGPQPRRRARGDAVAAGGRGGAPAPGAPRHAAQHRPRDRVRRAAPDPRHGDADRLRRLRDQPVRDVRVARRAGRSLAAARGPRPRRGGEADRQGDRQGPAEDDLQDGDLDDPVLLRRADLRGRRARPRADRPALHRHRVAHRRHRPARARRRGARAPLPRLPAHRP